MESRDEQLVSLFRSIFTMSGLVRFIRKNFGSQFAQLTLVKGSESGQVRGIVEDLVEKGLVDDRLFDLLRDKDPEHAELVDRVRAVYVPVESTAPESDESEADAYAGLSEERLAWRKKLESSLSDFTSMNQAKPAAWIDAASVLLDFDPAKLKAWETDDAGTTGTDLVSLAGFCHKRSDGRWELELRERREALAKLWRNGEIAATIERNAHERSLHTDLLRQMSDAHPLPFEAIADYPSLIAALDLAEWLSEVDADLFNVDRVHAAVERYERIEPLRKLVGTHFRGRVDELKALREHALEVDSGPPILKVWGIGGAGKSTVLGKYLLDYDAETEFPRPWAYLDFDDPSIDPADPSAMIGHIARHIGLLYAGVEVGEMAGSPESEFIAVESVSSADFRSDFRLSVDTEMTTDSQALIESLAEAIHALPIEPSLLLVLDTFEQIQVRGEHTVGVTRELLEQILEAMPFTRIVVSGRGDVRQWEDMQSLKIGDLDAESADQVLLALGVDNGNTRQTIIERLGTNPLTLRLVAEGIGSKKLTDDDLEHLVVGARSLELQGQLYTRILGHIPDGKVRRLAHPGLIVRRITRGVIADVLAEVCEIDLSQIDRLFKKLPDHVALFEPDESIPEEGEALRHRQDVRETMLRLMVEDPAWRTRLDTIHSKAIEHYGKFEHSIAKAEELYHRLMRDDEPSEFDALWSDELTTSLGKSWNEPFPERARLWLGTRLGHLEAEATEQLRVADRELAIAREVKSYLRSKDAEGALGLLEATPERSEGSPLYALHTRALTRLDRHEEALGTAIAGLENTTARFPRRTMELHMLAARAALELSNFEVLEKHSNEAIRVAAALDDTKTRLAMLDLQLKAEKKQGDTKDASTTAKELEDAFMNANERELRELPDVSEQVVSTLGADSRKVLRKAALTFGNRERQNVINQDVFQLEKLLLRAESSKAAKVDLGQLATQVGLPSKNYDMVDLAGAAIRYGRMGDAMAVVLDHAGNKADVRRATMDMFNLKTGAL